MASVAIFGGGVAGLTAAHELMERGFQVAVYDNRLVPGGKARSTTVPSSGTGGRRDLPGEHGFRFVPGFYQHLPDTMRRIPYPKSGPNATVFDNLVPTTQLQFPRPYNFPITLPDSVPNVLTWDGFWTALLVWLKLWTIAFEPDELEFFAGKIFQVATSCRARRLDEYEKLSWWDYIDADNRSKAYVDYLAVGLTRSLNACKAKEASTKTIGDILLQLFMDMFGHGVDNVLNGPTNDVWIDPWLAYLKGKKNDKVKYYANTTLKAISMDVPERKVVGAAILDENGKPKVVTADYYIVAVPIEVFARMLAPPSDGELSDLVKCDPTLAGILDIKGNVEWMNGIQFYLNKPFEGAYNVRGHLLFAESQWALTAVGQAQFWPDFPLSGFGDGTVKEILSVDISEWEKEGLNGKKAKDCTREEVMKETWAQLKQSLNWLDLPVLTDDMMVGWNLDEDIVQIPSSPSDPVLINREPLLVNYVNSWNRRPDAYTRIPNLFLAADYVRTFTDLATMEGANEAARRAVNAILADQQRDDFCTLWQLNEPDLFGWARAYDQKRFDCGLPWKAWDGKSDCDCGPKPPPPAKPAAGSTQ